MDPTEDVLEYAVVVLQLEAERQRRIEAEALVERVLDILADLDMNVQTDVFGEMYGTPFGEYHSHWCKAAEVAVTEYRAKYKEAEK